jgi:hypothetical protein
LEVITTVIIAPYPFYFVVVPRRTSNLREVRFGEVAVLKQISVLVRAFLPLIFILVFGEYKVREN